MDRDLPHVVACDDRIDVDKKIDTITIYYNHVDTIDEGHPPMSVNYPPHSIILITSHGN